MTTLNPRTRPEPQRRPGLGSVLTLIAGLFSAALFTQGCGSTPPAAFKTPDEAVQALVGALKPMDRERLRQILGSDSDDIVASGDDVADAQNSEKVVDLYNQKHELVASGDGVKTLQIGPEDWPLPIPLVEDKGTWSFDTQAGKEEILNRRIGRNELDVIQTCLAIVDAQREYAMLDPDQAGMGVYASKFWSDPGKHNGLYWEAAPEEPASPMGPLVAEAAEEGYTRASGGATGPRPYHGYCYHFLTGQGPGAPGGAFDYMVGGRMIGGFGVVAWPASYQSSGVMTFITNHDGVVYQKDLGEGTERAARSMTRFDPSDGWTKVEPGK